MKDQISTILPIVHGGIHKTNRWIKPQILRPQHWVAPSFLYRSPLCITTQMAECYWSRRLLLTLWQSTSLTGDSETERRAQAILAYSIFEIKMATEPQLTPGQAKPTDQYFFKTWTASPTKALLSLLFETWHILWKTQPAERRTTLCSMAIIRNVFNRLSWGQILSPWLGEKLNSGIGLRSTLV
jgi:hypothetical protein